MLAKTEALISLRLVKSAIRRYGTTFPPCPPQVPLPPEETCTPCPPPCQLPCPPPPCPPTGPYGPSADKPPSKIPHPPFYHCPRNKYEVHWIYINDTPPNTTMKDFFDRASQICFWTEIIRG